MLKRRAISLTVLMVVILGVVVVVVRWRHGTETPRFTSRTLPFRDASVHYWFTNGDLLLRSGSRLIRHNPLVAQTQTGDSPVIEAPQPSSIVCVSEEAMIVHLYPEPAQRKAKVEHSPPVARRFIDWNRPDHFETLNGPMAWWQVNLLDCAPYDYLAEKAKTHIIEGKPVSQDTSLPKLLKSKDGWTEAYPTGNPGEWLILATNSHSGTRQLRVTMPAGARASSFMKLRPWHDARQDAYLWYTARAFDGDPATWSTRAWEVTPELTLRATLELPAGPWVYPHSFLKKLSCFSCGCSCYEDFSVQMQNAQIYAMVGGQAVESKHQGLYKLLAPPASEHARWVLVAHGPDMNPQFAVSPDGCHVAYSRKGQVFLVSVCEEKK